MRAGKRYLADLLARDALDIPAVGEDDMRTDTGYEGLGFTLVDTDEFRDLKAELKKCVRNTRARRRPVEAAELLSVMKYDPTLFAEQISVGRAGRASYWNTPVVHHIGARDFVSAVLALEPEQQSMILNALRDRYTTGGAMPALKAELPWLRRVRAELRRELPRMRPMSKHRTKGFITYCLDPVLAPPAKASVPVP